MKRQLKQVYPNLLYCFSVTSYPTSDTKMLFPIPRYHRAILMYGRGS